MARSWKRIEETNIEARLNFIDKRIDNAKHNRTTDTLAMPFRCDQLMELRGRA